MYLNSGPADIQYSYSPGPKTWQYSGAVGFFMMTSSYGNIFRVTGHLCGEFTGGRWIPHTKPVTRSFDVFYVRLNKRLSKQWWSRLLETSSRPLWRHCNALLSKRLPSTNELWWNYSSSLEAYRKACIQYIHPVCMSYDHCWKYCSVLKHH